MMETKYLAAEKGKTLKLYYSWTDWLGDSEKRFVIEKVWNVFLQNGGEFRKVYFEFLDEKKNRLRRRSQINSPNTLQY